MAVVRRQPAFDHDHVERLSEEYANAKAFAEKAAKHAETLKKQLSSIVEAQGDHDDKGHIWYDAGPFDLKRERRVSRSLDTAAAERWARDNGVWDQVKKVVEVLSEESLLELAWERQDLSPTISSFYSEKETWAFKLVEKKENTDDTD